MFERRAKKRADNQSFKLGNGGFQETRLRLASALSEMR